MENRKEVVKEYFQLIVLLNRGNKKPNEKTELTLKIITGPSSYLGLTASLKESNMSQYIVLSVKIGRDQWERTGYSGFDTFEGFCTNELNSQTKRSLDLSLLEQHLTKKLRSLGIEHDF